MLIEISGPLIQLKGALFCLFKGLLDRPKGSLSSRSTGNLAHCCHKTGEEYSEMRNVPCTLHYRTAQNEQVVAN